MTAEQVERVHRVSKWLGWRCDHLGHMHLTKDVTVWIHEVGVGHSELVLFAAYVKAELAKRDVTIIPVIDNPNGCTLHMRAWKGAAAFVVSNPYDPTDPLSEADAIIRAADEVREVEQEGAG